MIEGDYGALMENVGKTIDASGVAAIVLGGALAGATFVKRRYVATPVGRQNLIRI